MRLQWGGGAWTEGVWPGLGAWLGLRAGGFDGGLWVLRCKKKNPTQSVGRLERGRKSGDHTRPSLPPHLKCTSKTHQRQITAFRSIRMINLNLPVTVVLLLFVESVVGK